MQKSTHTAEYSALCDQLVSMRNLAGLTQRELASILQVGHSWVAKVESGERRIDLIEFAWFCDACRINPVEGATKLLSGIRRTTHRDRQNSSTIHSRSSNGARR